ncbi:hypothetical protein B484DRAFT_407516 [Ochromonadaceae sp. CCMP2298]|nr:hypothetical protein B484DRAFT_407516 [Ochromonadaceae sp. CCMP2298]
MIAWTHGAYALLILLASATACEYAHNTDWAPSTWSLGAEPAKTPEDCCRACAGLKGCVVAPYFEGVCYLKAPADVANGSYFKAVGQG